MLRVNGLALNQARPLGVARPSQKEIVHMQVAVPKHHVAAKPQLPHQPLGFGNGRRVGIYTAGIGMNISLLI